MPAPALRPFPNSRYWLALFAGMAAVYLLLFACPSLWKKVLWLQAMPASAYPFLDMQGHLASSEAYASGHLVPGRPVPGDPLGRAHVGPLSMLWLGRLGLRAEHYLWFAAVCLLLFLAAATLTLRPRRGVETIWGLLCLTTPAVLLLVERGNIDLLLFAVLAAAFALLAPAGRWRSWLGWALISGFVGFKYYPALGYAAVLESGGTAAQRRWQLALGALVAGVFIAATWAELRAVAAQMPGSPLYPAFGAGEIFRLAGLAPATATVAGALGWLVGASALALGLGPFEAMETTADPRRLPFAGGGAVLCFAFIATASPDYRVVFFLFCLPWLLALRDRGRPAVRFLAVAAAVLFIATPWLAMLAGRVAVASRSLDNWWLVMLAKQLGWWTLMLLLGALVLRNGWAGLRRLSA